MMQIRFLSDYAISSSICLLACFYIYVLVTSISPTGENERGLMFKS